MSTETFSHRQEQSKKLSTDDQSTEGQLIEQREYARDVIANVARNVLEIWNASETFAHCRDKRSEGREDLRRHADHAALHALYDLHVELDQTVKDMYRIGIEGSGRKVA